MFCNSASTKRGTNSLPGTKPLLAISAIRPSIIALVSTRICDFSDILLTFFVAAGIGFFLFWLISVSSATAKTATVAAKTTKIISNIIIPF